MTAHPTCETCKHATPSKAKKWLICQQLSTQRYALDLRPQFYCALHSDLAKGEEDWRTEEGDT